MATTNPIFPANRAQLNGLASVLEITCCESKGKYEKAKATRASPGSSSAAGDEYRRCSKDTLFEVVGGDCKEFLDSLITCNKKNEYSHATKCKSARDALVKCAVKNKIGELGKNYSF